MTISSHPHPTTPPRSLILLGGGGHALVVAEAAALSKTLIAGFLDDNPAAPLAAVLLDAPQPFPAPTRLGLLTDLARLDGHAWIVAVGDLAQRRAILDLLARALAEVGQGAVVKHPESFISPSARVGRGVFVGPRAVVHSRAKVGDHAIVNTGAIVEHDCAVGENAHIAPGAALGGNVRIGRDTLVGLGSRVLPGIRIGQGATVGAGAVVIRDVPDGVTVVGVPAGER